MSDGALRITVGGQQLSSTDAQRKCILSRKHLEHFFFRQRRRDVGCCAQRLVQRSRFRFDVSSEFTIEISFAQLQNLLQHVGCAGFLAVERKHAQNRIEPETFSYKLANLRRLKVSYRKILSALRSLKSSIEIRHLEPPPVHESAHKHRVPIITPTRPRASLLVNRESFGEPARDAVVSHLQRDDERVFVPERAAPVELACFTR